jgi:hypothetical protein
MGACPPPPQPANNAVNAKADSQGNGLYKRSNFFIFNPYLILRVIVDRSPSALNKHLQEPQSVYLLLSVATYGDKLCALAHVVLKILVRSLKIPSTFNAPTRGAIGISNGCQLFEACTLHEGL